MSALNIASRSIFFSLIHACVARLVSLTSSRPLFRHFFLLFGRGNCMCLKHTCNVQNMHNSDFDYMHDDIQPEKPSDNDSDGLQNERYDRPWSVIADGPNGDERSRMRGVVATMMGRMGFNTNLLIRNRHRWFVNRRPCIGDGVRSGTHHGRRTPVAGAFRIAPRRRVPCKGAATKTPPAPGGRSCESAPATYRTMALRCVTLSPSSTPNPLTTTMP